MSDNFVNRLHCAVTSAPGLSSDLILGAPVAGFRALGAAQNGQQFTVTLEDGNAWEVRSGCTYTHATLTLTRGTLQDSSTGAAIALGSNTRVIGALSSLQAGRIGPWNAPGAMVTLASVIPAFAIDVTQSLNTKTITANETFTFSNAAPAPDTWVSLHITNSGASRVTVTIPNSFSDTYGLNITSFVCQVGRVHLQFHFTGTGWEVFGAPGPINSFGTATVPALTDDSADGFGAGSTWLNTATNQAYLCRSAAVGAAVWVPLNPPPDIGLDDLADVTVAGAALNSVLRWNGTAWVAVVLSAPVIPALDDITNVNAPAPATNALLAWSGTEWVAVPKAALATGVEGNTNATTFISSLGTGGISISSAPTTGGDISILHRNNPGGQRISLNTGSATIGSDSSFLEMTPNGCTLQAATILMGGGTDPVGSPVTNIPEMTFQAGISSDASHGGWIIFAGDAGPVIKLGHGGLLTSPLKLGFFGIAPVAQPAAVPVTAAGIHAALVALGLIT